MLGFVLTASLVLIVDTAMLFVSAIEPAPARIFVECTLFDRTGGGAGNRFRERKG